MNPKQSAKILVRHEGCSPRERSSCGWRDRLISREDAAVEPAAWAHAVDIDGAKLHYHKRATELYYVLDGEGMVLLPGNPVSLVNFKSDDVSVRFSYLNRQGGRRLYYGFDVSGKLASDGVLALLQNNQWRPGAKVRFNIGWTNLLTSMMHGGNTDWLTAQLGYNGNKLTLFSADEDFDSQINKPVFHAPGFHVGYVYAFAGEVLLGIKTGVSKRNNYKKLTEVEVGSVETIMDEASGSVRLVQKDEVTARQGDFVEKYAPDLRLHSFWNPGWVNQRVGFTAYGSSVFSSNKAIRTTDVGIGLHLLKQGSPTVALGGFVVGVKDVFDSDGTGKSVGKRLTVSLQGGTSLF